MSEIPGRRGRRKDPAQIERRRTDILDAAALLFAKAGYPATDLQDVADQLGLAKGTIYLYFPSKEELFLAAVDRGMNLLRDYVRSAYAGIEDPLERLTTAIRAYLEFFKKHPHQAELLIIERAEFRDRKKPTYQEHHETNVVQWRAVYSGLIREKRVRSIPVKRIIDVISDLVYGTMFTNHFSGQHKPLATQARDVIDIVFNGILTPAEQRRRAAGGKPGRLTSASR